MKLSDKHLLIMKKMKDTILYSYSWHNYRQRRDITNWTNEKFGGRINQATVNILVNNNYIEPHKESDGSRIVMVLTEKGKAAIASLTT